MIQKHRISTNVGKDQLVTVEINQDYDLLEILSLKFTQKEIYTSLCSDYGVVCGRVSVNNGFGIPNAKVSIFIPLDDIDSNDPVISALYPYKLTNDKDSTNHRYNLLPARKQHGGHEPTGTFPDQMDVLTREEVLEVFEKYYKYTVKTNDSGDFMIWGVPVGPQTLHIDVDMSDIGCFSLRPDDFIRQGMGVDNFKNSYTFKSSEDLDSLPQVVSTDKTIEVYPFWGNTDICQIGITRSDFDLSSMGVKIEPKAYLLGSIFTDQGKNSVNKNCTPRRKMGSKCNLTSHPATVEIIRFTSQHDSNQRPILEEYQLNEDIGDDGAFVLPVPMNMDFIYTNEFGENEITNDPNKGIPTNGFYRFRISVKNQGLGRVRTTGTFLVPNIREYENIDSSPNLSSYAFSTNLDDYPSGSVDSLILNKDAVGEYHPLDYFYKLTYNKVFAVSSFVSSYFTNDTRESYVAIKEVKPREEEDCEDSVNPFPVNFGIEKMTFAILLAIIINTFQKILYTVFLNVVEVLIVPFDFLYRNVKLEVWFIHWHPFNFLYDAIIKPLQRFGTLNLGTEIYPDCESCDNQDITITPQSPYGSNPTGTFLSVGVGTAIKSGFVLTGGTTTDVSTILGGAPANYLLLTAPNQTPIGAVNPSWTPVTYSGVTYDFNTIYTGGTSYLITNTVTNRTINLVIGTYVVSGTTYYYHNDLSINGIADWTDNTNYEYSIEIYNETIGVTSGSTISLNSENLLTGCAEYMKLYDESLVDATYCVTDPLTPYSGLTAPVSGAYCTAPGTVRAGQIVGNGDANIGGLTKSGYSEFRNGLFTIVPAAGSTDWWNKNNKLIAEFCRRKLTSKLFCEGLVNYSFIDNWLTGTLYMFPFKEKIRWTNESLFQLNDRRTHYCRDLVVFKPTDKIFYYKSASFNGTTFTGKINNPTTIADLGPRDEFIKEICVDPNLDPNCSVIREVGSTSFKDFGDLLGLYINYRMDVGNTVDYTNFFTNTGFNSIIHSKQTGRVLNGDVLQLMSINSEVGIEPFDLQDKHYQGYSPLYLDPNEHQTLFGYSGGTWGPLAINMELIDDGFRIRDCINEPGRLTETTQPVPFYYWDKKGVGFGPSGTNNSSQSFDYSNIELQSFHGMTHAYAYTGVTSYPYILYPMTMAFSGLTIDMNGGNVASTEITFDVESYTDTHTLYSDQPEGFTFLYITAGDSTLSGATDGTIYTRVGESSPVSTTGNWATQTWNHLTSDFIIKPTSNNYIGNKQILSTPFQFYFGLRPGKTAVDKFIERFGPRGAFTTVN